MDEKKKCGFASMTPERRKEVASMGGKKAHEMGVANRWNSETAAAAGRKVGVRYSKEHMAALGKKGGAISAAKRRKVPNAA